MTTQIIMDRVMAVLTLYNIFNLGFSLLTELSTDAQNCLNIVFDKEEDIPCCTFRKKSQDSLKEEGDPKRCWNRPGRTEVWSDNLMNDVMVSEEWKENF